jgi:hypothetical protein
MLDQTILTLEAKYEHDLNEKMNKEISMRRGFAWEVSNEFKELEKRASKVAHIRMYLKKPKWLFGYKCPECGSSIRKLSLDNGQSWAWYTTYFECECGYEYAEEKYKFMHFSVGY